MIRNWVERWWLRSISRAECSPSMFIVVLVLGMVLLAIHYHNMIVSTIVATLWVALATAVVVVAVVAGKTIYAWNKKPKTIKAKASRKPVTVPAPAASVPPVTHVEVPDDITAKTDILADELSEFLAEKAGEK